MTTRRRFLEVLAGAAVLGGCGDDSAEPVSGPVAAGNVSDLPVNTLRVAGGKAVAIGRDDAGVYAMTLICTHEQCDIATQGSVSFVEVACNCHGSRFDHNGGVVQGPAADALEHYQVDIDSSGAMTIQAGTVVGASTRTAVPS